MPKLSSCVCERDTEKSAFRRRTEVLRLLARVPFHLLVALCFRPPELLVPQGESPPNVPEQLSFRRRGRPIPKQLWSEPGGNRLCRTWAKAAHTWSPMPVEIAQHLSEVASQIRCQQPPTCLLSVLRPKFGRVWSHLSRHRAKLGPIRANLAAVRPMSTGSAQSWPGFEQNSAMLTNVGEIPGNFEMHPQHLRPVRSGATIFPRNAKRFRLCRPRNTESSSAHRTTNGLGEYPCRNRNEPDGHGYTALTGPSCVLPTPVAHPPTCVQIRPPPTHPTG